MPIYLGPIVGFDLLNYSATERSRRRWLQQAFGEVLADALNHVEPQYHVATFPTFGSTGYVALLGELGSAAEFLKAIRQRTRSDNFGPATQPRWQVHYALHFGLVCTEVGDRRGDVSGSGIEKVAALLHCMPRNRPDRAVITDSYRSLLVEHEQASEATFQPMDDLIDRDGGTHQVWNYCTKRFGVDLLGPTALPDPQVLRQPGDRLSVRLDLHRGQDLERALFEGIQDLTHRIDQARLGDAALPQRLPLTQLYITLIADRTSSEEHRRARDLEERSTRSEADEIWQEVLRPSPTSAARRIMRDELPTISQPEAKVARPPARPDKPPSGALEMLAGWDDTAIVEANPEALVAVESGETLHAVCVESGAAWCWEIQARANQYCAVGSRANCHSTGAPARPARSWDRRACPS